MYVYTCITYIYIITYVYSCTHRCRSASPAKNLQKNGEQLSKHEALPRVFARKRTNLGVTVDFKGFT